MKTERIQGRISPEKKKQLQELAAAENRTISNMIEILIDKELKKIRSNEWNQSKMQQNIY